MSEIIDTKLIKAMIETLNLENIILVGISAGGLTVIELTNQLQKKVQKPVLISAVTKKMAQTFR